MQIMMHLQLLGLRKNEVIKDSDLNTVYEQLVGSAMEAGYSESATTGRSVSMSSTSRADARPAVQPDA